MLLLPSAAADGDDARRDANLSVFMNGAHGSTLLPRFASDDKEKQRGMAVLPDRGLNAPLQPRCVFIFDDANNIIVDPEVTNEMLDVEVRTTDVDVPWSVRSWVAPFALTTTLRPARSNFTVNVIQVLRHNASARNPFLELECRSSVAMSISRLPLSRRRACFHEGGTGADIVRRCTIIARKISTTQVQSEENFQTNKLLVVSDCISSLRQDECVARAENLVCTPRTEAAFDTAVTSHATSNRSSTTSPELISTSNGDSRVWFAVATGACERVRTVATSQNDAAGHGQGAKTTLCSESRRGAIRRRSGRRTLCECSLRRETFMTMDKQSLREERVNEQNQSWTPCLILKRAINSAGDVLHLDATAEALLGSVGGDLKGLTNLRPGHTVGSQRHDQRVHNHLAFVQSLASARERGKQWMRNGLGTAQRFGVFFVALAFFLRALLAGLVSGVQDGLEKVAQIFEFNQSKGGTLLALFGTLLGAVLALALAHCANILDGSARAQEQFSPKYSAESPGSRSPKGWLR
jgi:hypothetical protein